MILSSHVKIWRVSFSNLTMDLYLTLSTALPSVKSYSWQEWTNKKKNTTLTKSSVLITNLPFLFPTPRARLKAV